MGVRAIRPHNPDLANDSPEVRAGEGDPSAIGRYRGMDVVHGGVEVGDGPSLRPVDPNRIDGAGLPHAPAEHQTPPVWGVGGQEVRGVPPIPCHPMGVLAARGHDPEPNMPAHVTVEGHPSPVRRPTRVGRRLPWGDVRELH